MSAKTMRRETFERCPVHKAIRETALERMKNPGYFEKSEIVAKLEYRAIAEVIRWDYVREWLEEQNHTKIVPVSESFFRMGRNYSSPRAQKAAEMRTLNPARCLATGKGKHTVGYCGVDFENGVLAIKRFSHLTGAIRGRLKGAEDFRDAIQTRLPGSTVPEVSDSIKPKAGPEPEDSAPPVPPVSPAGDPPAGDPVPEPTEDTPPPA